MSSHHTSYQPLSPPWSPPSLSPARTHGHGTRYDRAPAMPYVPLPPCDEPHYGMITPPPTPPRIHPVLAARPTIVRYDLAADPRTMRMSSSAPQPSFPARDPATQPSTPVVYIQCELTGHTIAVRQQGLGLGQGYAAAGGQAAAATGAASAGVTCFDVLAQLHGFFDETIPAEEWHGVRGAQREAMKEAYRRRTGRTYERGARVKMVDYLLGRSVFKSLVPKRSDASGSTWLLQTTLAAS